MPNIAAFHTLAYSVDAPLG